MIKAVIFDMDGTLIDTEKINRIAWPLAVAEMGYQMSDEQFLALRSLGRPFVLDQVREWFGEDFDYEYARQVKRKHYDAYMNGKKTERKEGAVELLEYLRSKRYITAVATATDLNRATELLNEVGLTPYFDRVISAYMVKQGKPAPDVYLQVCKELDLDPSQCIAVEDAPNGVCSAYQAGCKVIMIPDQSPFEEKLGSMLMVCLDKLSDIIPYMEEHQL